MTDQLPSKGTTKDQISEGDSDDRNRFVIAIQTELGCQISEGEYSVFIVKILSGLIAEDDFTLVQECVAEQIGELDLPAEGWTEFEINETGEREDVFWHKYYKLGKRL
jgi:hypothetical protein